MNAGPGMDIVVDYAQPMSVLSICDLLGVPVSDREAFESTSAALMPGECRRPRGHNAGGSVTCAPAPSGSSPSGGPAPATT